jgi:hypothetical protein
VLFLSREEELCLLKPSASQSRLHVGCTSTNFVTTSLLKQIPCTGTLSWIIYFFLRKWKPHFCSEIIRKFIMTAYTYCVYWALTVFVRVCVWVVMVAAKNTFDLEIAISCSDDVMKSLT